MLRGKYGKDMVATDKADLDAVLNSAIDLVGVNYGDVIDVACDTIRNGNYSPALKYNALHKTSWFRMYVKSYLEVR